MEKFQLVCFIWVLHFLWLSNGLSHVLLYWFTHHQFYNSSIKGKKTSNMNVSQLPGDLLGIVVDKLSCFEDYLRFSQVCRFTRRFVREEQCYQKPWVMLGNTPGDKTRQFYSPLERRFYNVKLPKVVRRSWCCGSYEGWLVMAHKTRGNFMYNPITQKRLRLPTHEVENIDVFTRLPVKHTKYIKRCPYFLSKIVLSSVPMLSSSSSPLLAVAIVENHRILVTSCLPGLDNKWQIFYPLTLEEEDGMLSPIKPQVFIEEDDKDEDQEEEVVIEDPDDERLTSHFVTDVIFYRGQFYAVSINGSLYVFNVGDSHEFSLEMVNTHPLKFKRKEVSQWNVNYLVESRHGELLMVVRIRTRSEERNHISGFVGRFNTIKFMIFKLDESNGEPFRWVKVESIGDQILFLGQQNYSKSFIDIGIRPGEIKGRGNSIYFTDHFGSNYYINNYTVYPILYKDSGVYHLENGRIDQLLPRELDHRLYTYRRYPIMFTPNPW